MLVRGVLEYDQNVIAWPMMTPVSIDWNRVIIKKEPARAWTSGLEGDNRPSDIFVKAEIFKDGEA